MKRISKRRAKFREKPLAARLHERSAKAAFELWTESIYASTLQRISAVIWSSVYEIIFKYRMSAGIFPEFRW